MMPLHTIHTVTQQQLQKQNNIHDTITKLNNHITLEYELFQFGSDGFGLKCLLKWCSTRMPQIQKRVTKGIDSRRKQF